MKVSKLLIMAGLHFLAMYFLMFSMIDNLGHFHWNLNNFYMAGLMTSPMLVIEILLMGSMYPQKKLLSLILGTSVTLLTLFFFFIRQQTFIGDERFLRSMIPHHSGAILMCQRGTLTDPEIQELCREIIESQEREIAAMEEILTRLD